MLDVDGIHKSTSPWASPVVLVWKKDGNLHFCIDLCKLNSHTIKDTYSLPHIEESLNCLNGSCIFTSLDLKAGYWQVLMDEDSIPLRAFSVGLLGLQVCLDALWVDEHTHHFPAAHGILSWGSTSQVLYYISWWYHNTFKNTMGTHRVTLQGVSKAGWSWVMLKT